MRKIVTYLKNKLGGKPPDTETRVVGMSPLFSESYGDQLRPVGMVRGQMAGGPAIMQNIPRENRDESYKKTQQGNPRPVSKSHAAILAQLSDGIPLTRHDLHSFTGISITSLCGRIAELVERGQVEVAGTKTDPVTQRKVTTYQLKEVR